MGGVIKYMFSKVFSGAILGLDSFIISVEADVSNGLPIFDMVGFLASEVKEARERVKIALKNCGYRLPSKRITVNLSPADIRKAGTAYDLPIAIAILGALGYITEKALKDVLIIGELSLDGSVNQVNGILPIIYSAKEQGFKRFIVPKGNAREGAVIKGTKVYGISKLKEAVDLLNGDLSKEEEKIDLSLFFKEGQKDKKLDFSDVSGQETLKRAIEVAVSGMHNILMIGPPGSGKTMLAKRIPTIMPDLSLEESMEVSKIYSIAGLMDNQALITKRPFRSPHHTITKSALVGGGAIPKPGEISLAHLGVLFLDELPEFKKETIEVLRQPLEDRYINISRLHGKYKYPSNLMMVAAMNPCSCGFYPDRNRCNCSINQVKRYLGRISRPMLDRFDICIEALQINYKELQNNRKEESSSDIIKRVNIARKMQIDRYKERNIWYNSQLTPLLIKKYCKLGSKEETLMEEAFRKLNLTARAYHRVLKVARTIADLDESDDIKVKHISEAICYRSIEQNIVYIEDGI